MANTQDYVSYLDEQIGISPATSQEELQAAQTIEELMRDHNVEVSVEEFDAPAWGRMPYKVLLVVLFIGLILSGVGPVALRVVGMILAVASTVILAMDYTGYASILESFGPAGRSQNVIAYHKASGPLVTKGVRPIVVVAHYDSPHESFLYDSQISPYLPMIRKYSPYCVLAVGIIAFFQILGFLPAGFRRLVWVIGLVAALPPLVIGIGAIAERFARCTLGANDNRSSVAALLGVLNAVSPSDRVLEYQPKERPAEDEQPSGIRRGKEVIEQLGILPESCEIEYVTHRGADATSTLSLARDEIVSAAAEGDNAFVADDSSEAKDMLLSGGARLSLVDDSNDDSDDSDDSDADQPTASFDPNSTMPVEIAPQEQPQSSTPGDASWGVSSYQPGVADVARRAILFDLPDPSEASADPFATDPEAKAVQLGGAAFRATTTTDASANRFRPISELPDLGDDLDEPEVVEDAPATQAEPRRFRLFGRRAAEPEESMSEWLGVDDDFDAREDGREIGSWENFDNSGSSRTDRPSRWKGGAAPREGLRLVDGEEPTEEELAEAVLSMDDDELLCHDIWCVALGSSYLDHAGMKAFLAEHRSDVRGAFLINLDCVGAGALTILTKEGLGRTRRADRRISRLLKNAAADLHVELAEAVHDWGTTDATPAMRKSMRGLTIMGKGENGLPAFSHTAGDVQDNIDAEQVATVANLVAEVIRRS